MIARRSPSTVRTGDPRRQRRRSSRCGARRGGGHARCLPRWGGRPRPSGACSCGTAAHVPSASRDQRRIGMSTPRWASWCTWTSRSSAASGRSYRSDAFRDLLAQHGIRHIRTRPYTPKTHGKAEAFMRILQREWAYAHVYLTSAHRARALPGWLRWYNNHRPHGGIHGTPPLSRVSHAARSYT